MFDFLILLFTTYGTLFIYSAIGFIAFMLVQGITYWTSGFSIYNWLVKKLFTEQLVK